MVATKPKRLSEVNSSDWAILTDVLGEVSGNQLFKCGSCNNSIRVKKDEVRPSFCAKCGTEIDWVDIFTKIIKVCSKCKNEYDEENKFCKLDGTKLDEIPVEK